MVEADTQQANSRGPGDGSGGDMDSEILRNRRQIALWLFGICALLFVMVTVGGATRLTESGLSITEWKPVTGAIPPLSLEAWETAFAKYREIPEYTSINMGMTLDEFKTIYWWEWSHRLLGRLIGLVFFVPFVIFLLRRKVERWLVPHLTAMFVLGGLQGALGWFMVKSGLTDRVDVSPYRLTAHLALAFAIYGYIFWVAVGLWRDPRSAAPPRGDVGSLSRWSLVLIAILYLQVLAGGFVAGLNAGFDYNTWPDMGGEWVPGGLLMLEPLWVNFFENVALVQFNHRNLAYILLVAVGLHWFFAQNKALGRTGALTSNLLFFGVVVQAYLGIHTLLAVVPVSLGTIHQAGAVVVFTFAVLNARVMRGLAQGSV